MSVLIYKKLLENLSIRISCWYNLREFYLKFVYYNIAKYCCIKKLKFKCYLNLVKNKKKYVVKKLTLLFYLKQKLFKKHINFVLRFKFEI